MTAQTACPTQVFLRHGETPSGADGRASDDDGDGKDESVDDGGRRGPDGVRPSLLRGRQDSIVS